MLYALSPSCKYSNNNKGLSNPSNGETQLTTTSKTFASIEYYPPPFPFCRSTCISQFHCSVEVNM
eukprot:m.143182 g.143182  ORF g.143182 m.143182 type:complete len:65 (+) comp13201_c0_seq1:12-206(+)